MSGGVHLLQLDLGAAPGASAGFERPLADGRLWSEPRIGPADAGAPRPGPRLEPRPETGDGRRIYDGPVEVEGARRRLEATRDADGLWRLRYHDGLELQLECGVDRSRVVRAMSGLRSHGGGAFEPARLLERALGAPTALALAERGIWLLHAAAVAAEGRALALAGASGAGKSTLAAAAAAAGARRLADDQLPVRAGAAASVLPRFPQLKLERGAAGSPSPEPPGDLPSDLPLGAVALVEHRPGLASARLERLAPGDAALALVHASVAARLFDGPLLERHLADCARIARAVPVVRAIFPSGRERAPEILRWLLDATGR